MNYPLISEYIESIKSAEDNFEELSYLMPVLGDDGLPVMTSSNFAVILDERQSVWKILCIEIFQEESSTPIGSIIMSKAPFHHLCMVI